MSIVSWALTLVFFLGFAAFGLAIVRAGDDGDDDAPAFLRDDEAGR